MVKYVIFKDNPIGAVAGYDKYSNYKEKEDNYKIFYYGKGTTKTLFDLPFNDRKNYCIKFGL